MPTRKDARNPSWWAKKVNVFFLMAFIVQYSNEPRGVDTTIAYRIFSAGQSSVPHFAYWYHRRPRGEEHQKTNAGTKVIINPLHLH